MDQFPKIREALGRLQSSLSSVSDDELKTILTVQSDDRMQLLVWIASLLDYQVSAVTEDVLYEELGTLLSDIGLLRLNETLCFIKATSPVHVQLKNWCNILSSLAIYKRPKSKRSSLEINDKIEELLKQGLSQDPRSADRSTIFPISDVTTCKTSKNMSCTLPLDNVEVSTPSLIGVPPLTTLQDHLSAVENWSLNHQHLLPKESSDVVVLEENSEKRVENLRTVVEALCQCMKNCSTILKMAEETIELTKRATTSIELDDLTPLGALKEE